MEHITLLFLGSLLFAVGEMACMPRFEQYLIGLLSPEKTVFGGMLLRIPVGILVFSLFLNSSGRTSA
jgi:hypothetical protein